MNRKWARIRAVQALYQIEMTGIDWQTAVEAALSEEEEADEFLEDIVTGTLKEMLKIDRRISDQLEHWTMERVGNVDRAVLRLAVYELIYRVDIPPNVSLNEAINTAKAFGGDEAGKFVNGVLSNVLSEYNQEAGNMDDSNDH